MEVENVFDPSCVFVRLDGHGGEEELDPPLVVAVLGNLRQAGVVLFSVGFKVGTHVKSWPADDAACVQEERYEDAADASIAVEERVDLFEAGMAHGDLHDGVRGVFVEVVLQVTQQRHDLLGGRRYVDRLVDACPRRPNVVLHLAKLTRCALRAPDSRHEYTVHPAQQIEREWPCLQLHDGFLDRPSVVEDLLDVRAFSRRSSSGVRFLLQDLYEGRLSPLDPRRQDSFSRA